MGGASPGVGGWETSQRISKMIVFHIKRLFSNTFFFALYIHQRMVFCFDVLKLLKFKTRYNPNTDSKYYFLWERFTPPSPYCQLSTKRGDAVNRFPRVQTVSLYHVN